jgi:hypothetical protein
MRYATRPRNTIYTIPNQSGERGLPCPPPTAIASIFINKKLTTNNYHHRLIYAWSSIDMTAYLRECNGWAQQVFEMVGWEHLELSINPIKQRSKKRVRTLYTIHDRHAEHRTSKTSLHNGFQHRPNNVECLPLLPGG